MQQELLRIVYWWWFLARVFPRDLICAHTVQWSNCNELVRGPWRCGWRASNDCHACDGQYWYGADVRPSVLTDTVRRGWGHLLEQHTSTYFTVCESRTKPVCSQTVVNPSQPADLDICSRPPLLNAKFLLPLFL